MAQLLDSSLWVALMRRGASQALKAMISTWALDEESVLAEPVIFELLRFASEAEAKGFGESSEGMTILTTPPDVWQRGWELGQACKRKGFVVEGIDLLIAAVAIHHDVSLVTFDGDFEKISKVAGLKVRLLKVPTG